MLSVSFIREALSKGWVAARARITRSFSSIFRSMSGTVFYISSFFLFYAFPVNVLTGPTTKKFISYCGV